MTNSCLPGKALLAFGICLVLLSIGSFVGQAYANCQDCSSELDCEREVTPLCGATGGVQWTCTGGISCFVTSPCRCKPPTVVMTRCHCG